MKESQHTEWKESWRDDHLRWVCGFANAEGGVLVIGRNDRGEVVGVADASKLLEDLPNKVRDLLGILVEVNLRTESGREYLEVVTPAYPTPISYRGHYYQRSGSTLQELKGAALDRFILRKQGRHWDGVPLPRVTVGDLDPRALVNFRQRAARSQRLPAEALTADDASLIDKLHLTIGDGELKRAAVLLFHPEPERFFTGAYIKIGFFRADADLAYHDEIHGGLVLQVGETMDRLLAKYLKASIVYEGVQRIETWPVPEPALREALLNAIAHKDYGSGTPIQISVYADRLLIWNPGQLPPDWTVEQLSRKHASFPFNPDVANVFFRAGMIESWGRGIERMFAECTAAGAPAPQLRHESTGLWAEFAFAHPPADPVADPVTDPVTDPVDQLLLALGDKTLAPSLIQQRLALKHRPTFRANYLHPALEQGLIEMTLPDKPSSRLQQYRLTANGRARWTALTRGQKVP